MVGRQSVVSSFAVILRNGLGLRRQDFAHDFAKVEALPSIQRPSLLVQRAVITSRLLKGSRQRTHA